MEEKQYTVFLIYQHGQIDTYLNCTKLSYSEIGVISFRKEDGKLVESIVPWKVLEQ